MNKNKIAFPDETLLISLFFSCSWRELKQRYISHFRTERSESHSWPNLFRKQEDCKTTLLFLVPKSQRKAVFTSNNAEDVLTQCIFIVPPLLPLVRLQLFLGNMRARLHSENIDWLQCSQTTYSPSLLLLLTGGFGIELCFFLFLLIMLTAVSGCAGPLIRTMLKYFQTQNMHGPSKAARDIWNRKDQTQHR